MVPIVSDPLSDRVRRDGPRRALVDRSAGFWVSWNDLHLLATEWVRRFRSAGVQPGQRVLVQEQAGVRFAALMHACLRLGVAMVPVSPRAPGAELERVRADARPAIEVRDGELEVCGNAAGGDPADAFVLYTSGTTGAAKGVRQTLANHMASALGCQESLSSVPSDRWLLCLSPHHVGGLAILLRSVISNQPVVSLARFDEQAVLSAVEQERVTLVSVVPTMLIRLLDAGGLETLRTLRAILVGGAPAPAELVRSWAGLGLKVCPTYGLTETCSQVATIPIGRAAELAGASGYAHSHAGVSIAGGQVIVSGEVVSPGYLNPDLQPAPQAGRFETGDAGRIDSDGLIWIDGRLDDAIITGGENVQPEEVESVLRAIPGVADAAVVGSPDPVWGSVIEALVVGEVREEDLLQWCRERLAPFKVPRRVRFTQSLPRSDGGKLLRRLLR